MSSDQKVAVITGAGSGVGRAAAVSLNREGYSLALAGRRVDALEETMGMLDGGTPSIVVQTDIADADRVANLFAETQKAFGRLDLLFNNAGGGAPRIAMEDLDLADWRQVVDVNLTGSFMCAQQAIRMMKAQDPQGGRIVNNGSVSALVPRPDTVAYTATKHAMTGLTKCIALDCRKYGIACTQIDIGNADTPLAARFKEGVPQANGEIMVEPVFDVAHVGDTIAAIAALPLDTNVLFMTIMATNMPLVGRG